MCTLYLLRFLALAAEDFDGALEHALCAGFGWGEGHGLPAQDEGLPFVDDELTFSHQTLLLLLQLGGSQLHTWI